MKLLRPVTLVFHQTIRVGTQSGFSDFVDFVRITKTSQDNHYVNPFVLLMPLSLPLKTLENLKVYLLFSVLIFDFGFQLLLLTY